MAAPEGTRLRRDDRPHRLVRAVGVPGDPAAAAGTGADGEVEVGGPVGQDVAALEARRALVRAPVAQGAALDPGRLDAAAGVRAGRPEDREVARGQRERTAQARLARVDLAQGVAAVAADEQEDALRAAGEREVGAVPGG